MAYTYSLNSTNYLIKIKELHIDVQQSCVGITIVKVNTSGYVISEIFINITEAEFSSLCIAVPVGSTLYDVIKIAAWDIIEANYLEELILGRALEADEVLPTLTEVI